MKFKRVTMRNFKGIPFLDIPLDKKITILTGENGTGKTSGLQGVVYGLTGEYPDNPIRFGEKEMSVRIDTGTFEFERIQVKDKPNKVKYNGKSSTGKVIEKELFNYSGNSITELKAVSSTNLIKNVEDAAAFEKFLMSYLNESMTLDDITGMFPAEYKELTAKDIEDSKDILPEYIESYGPYGIGDIEKIVSELRESRKYLKKRVAELDVLSQNVVSAPTRSKEDVQKDIEILLKKEAEQESQDKLIRSYEAAKASRDLQLKQIKDLEDEISKINVSSSNKVAITKLEEEKNALTDEKTKLEKSIGLMENSVRTLKNVFENLEKPVCPLSDKLTCTVDKKPLKDDISASIAETEESILEQQDVINTLAGKIDGINAKLNTLKQEEIQYERKLVLIKNLEETKKALITLPSKPANAEHIDYTAQKTSLRSELKVIEENEKSLDNAAKKEKLQRDVELLSFLIDILDLKGVVREKIVSNYLQIFDDTVNNRLKVLLPQYEMRFVSDDGIKIELKTDHSDFIPYTNLSGGEKTIALLFVLDLLNQLTGVNILFLDGDDLSRLDENSFLGTLDFIINGDFGDIYDHIFINCLNNEKTMNLLKGSQNISIIEL